MLLNDNPVMQDRNTSVGLFPWENDSGSVDAFDLTNSQTMTDNTLSMVDELDTRTEANVVNENTTPEGADEGQTGDQGGDADGQNFGQDQGSQDTMAAESTGMDTKTKVAITVGLTTLALIFGKYLSDN